MRKLVVLLLVIIGVAVLAAATHGILVVASRSEGAFGRFAAGTCANCHQR
jgi:cytochrome c553